MRIGQGIDVHRLVEGRPCILAGVNIPATRGLLGHSDADVVVHAAIDALLGAVAWGDIGKWFPDSDPKYKDICSLDLLAIVSDRLTAEGYILVNIDITVVAEEPRLAPYILQMRHNLAEVMNVDVGRISIKATTSEGLGFTGTKEGILASAVALVREVKC